MGHVKQLRYIDQLGLFKLRNMGGIDFQVTDLHNFKCLKYKRTHLDKQIKSISSIGYYTLKDYAYPFYNEKSHQYSNLDFDQLIARYYRDKHLKQYVLQAIEDIEVSLNTSIAFYLGSKYGAYGYKDFYKWCQTSGKNKFLNNKTMNKFSLAQEKLSFFKDLQYKVKKSSMIDIQEYLKHSNDIFPPIWLMVSVLTLGDSIHIFKLMSKAGRNTIAASFNCSTEELVSWLECINLIRNICCHNGNLVDLRLRTKPKIPTRFTNHLFSKTLENGTQYTDRVALPISIIASLMNTINPKYKFDELYRAIKQLCQYTDTPAQKLGFHDFEHVALMLNIKSRNKSHHKPRRSKKRTK